MSKQFQHGIFGCFSDTRLCLLTFCVPCYTIGKNAEYLGEDCLLIGLLAALGLPFGPVVRWRLRQQKDLEGSMIVDSLLYMILPCCALIQEAKEIGWSLPEEIQNAGKKRGEASTPDQTQEMSRE